MGVGAAEHIRSRLLAAGIDPDTPVTVVENGTLPTQKVATDRIAGLSELLIDQGIKGPAMIFVGAHPAPRPAPSRATARDPRIRSRPHYEEIAA
jgi:siroheme synthase